jgi:hypothetical protein
MQAIVKAIVCSSPLIWWNLANHKKTKAPEKGEYYKEQNERTHVQEDKWTISEGKLQGEYQVLELPSYTRAYQVRKGEDLLKGHRASTNSHLLQHHISK